MQVDLARLEREELGLLIGHDAQRQAIETRQIARCAAGRRFQ